MTIYASTFTLYDKFLLNLGKKRIDLSADTFKALLVSSSYTPDAAAHEVLADITGELSGNGYARATLANVALTMSAGVLKFDADDISFSAVGGDLVARRIVIFDDTAATPLKPLVGFGLLRATNVDATIANGNTATYQINAAGLFTIA